MPLKKTGPYSNISTDSSYWEEDPFFEITNLNLDEDNSQDISDIFDPDINYKYKERKLKKPEDFFHEKELTIRDYELPPDTFENIFDINIDYSLGAFLYLKALGYKECIWNLN